MDAKQHDDSFRKQWQKLSYRYRYLPFVGFWGTGLKLLVLHGPGSISIAMSRGSYWFMVVALIALGPVFSWWIVFGWGACLSNKIICMIAVFFSAIGWIVGGRLLFREKRVTMDRNSESVLFFIGRKPDPVFKLAASDIEYIGIESRLYQSEDPGSAERTGLVRLSALGSGDLVICSFRNYGEAAALCHDIADLLGTQCVEHRAYSPKTNST